MRRSVIWIAVLAIGMNLAACAPQKAEEAAPSSGETTTKVVIEDQSQAPLPAEAFAIRGVIEGFYGKPWTNEQRTKMFTFMAKQRFNTYVYAPKDDPYQRLQWGDLYPEQEAKSMKALIQAAEQQGIRFVYSISPGIPLPMPGEPETPPEIAEKSITFSAKADRERLAAKIKQLREMGVHTFMLSFDDVTEKMKDKDRGIYGTDYAQAHMELANAVLQEQKQLDPNFELWFAPTKYSGLKDMTYWQTLRGKLDPSVQVIWTGPEILSKSITSEQADQVAKWLGRKPLIWDNYPVNDYTYTINKHPQLLMGPIEGRDGDLGQHTAGLLANPMIQPEASKLSLFTIGKYLQSPKTYDPRKAWAEALTEGVGGGNHSQGYAAVAFFARSSMLRQENAEFQQMVEAYWREYAKDPKSGQKPLRERFESVRNVLGMQSEISPELWAEIEPWAEKLAMEGEMGLLVLDMFELEPSDPKRQELRMRIQSLLAKAEQNPLTVGEEILPFIKTALQK